MYGIEHKLIFRTECYSRTHRENNKICTTCTILWVWIERPCEKYARLKILKGEDVRRVCIQSSGTLLSKSKYVIRNGLSFLFPLKCRFELVVVEVNWMRCTITMKAEWTNWACSCYVLPRLVKKWIRDMSNMDDVIFYANNRLKWYYRELNTIVSTKS